MNIQNTPIIKLHNQQPQQQKQNEAQKPSFKGMEVMDIALRFLDTNQAWGATAVDLGCMVAPRTAVDFTRGPEAGFETLRREATSTANDALVGVYGLGAAALLAHGINKKYGLKAQKIFVSEEMLDILGNTWNKNIGDKKQLNKYLNEVVSEIKGFNPNHKAADNNGYVSIDKKTQKEIIDRFTDEFGKNNDKISKETKEFITSKITAASGSEHRIKIEKEVGGKNIKSVSSAGEVVDNIFTATKAFTKDKVAATFDGKNIADNTFIKALKKHSTKTSILGLSAVLAVAMSVQPINMYLTKKKTGNAGFVGGGEPDESKGFKVKKTLVAGLAALGTFASIGKPSQILKELRFKSLTPTIPQFKLIYGLTIMSRFLSARNDNELRESSIKDTLGFANWLILGGFISKLTAGSYDKLSKFVQKGGESFVRYNENENGKGFFKWLIKSDIVTRDEILHNALKKAGVDVTTAGKNGSAMTFKEMMKKAKDVAPLARKQTRALNLIQVAGYVWSGVVLGFGVPKLNIAITKHFENKRKAKEAETKAPEKI